MGPFPLRGLLDGISTIADTVGGAAPGQVLRIRLHAIACRNKDGLMADGFQPMPLADLGALLQKEVAVANQIFKTADIELVFYPSIDLEERQDPGLNYDWWLDPHDARLWNPEISASEVAELAYDDKRNFNRDPYRDDNARAYKGKLVLMIAEGQEFVRPDAGWRRCGKCQGLFRLDINGSTASSKCPAGGSHDQAGSGTYALFGVSDPLLGERRWHLCSACWGLFFAGSPGGQCPAGPAHASMGAKYTLLRDRPDKPGESNWRRCQSCEGLFLASGPGVCPSGGQHSKAGTASYTLTLNEPGPWLMHAPSSGWYSDIGREFVRIHEHNLDFWGGGTLAHEIGHYLGLAHTHGDFLTLTEGEYLDPQLTAEQKMRKAESRMRDGYDLNGEHQPGILSLLSQGYTAKQAIDQLFDYDAPRGVKDTPADCGELAIAAWNQAWGAAGKKCGPMGKFIVSSKEGDKQIAGIEPDRANVMGYYGCEEMAGHFSPDQAIRIREMLLTGKRRHLVDVQLGSTGAPHEVRCGVWMPSTDPQKVVMGYASDDFDQVHANLVATGLRLRAHQAYLAPGRKEVLWDGLWSAGSHPQSVIQGWTPDDFVAEREKQLGAGMRLVHLQSYVLPDGAIRVNAIWNPGTGGEHFVQGYTEDDLHTRASELLEQGLGITHLNGWNLPDGQLRFDAIFRAGSEQNGFMTGWAIEDLVKKYDEMWGQEIKLLVLDSCLVGGELRYNTIWSPEPDPQVVVWEMTREQVLAWHEELRAQGMTLSSLNLARTPAGASDRGSA